MSYYDNYNPDIFNLITKKHMRICEFGCGAGGLAKKIKESFPNSFYAGIELVEDQINLAKPYLDLAICYDLNHKMHNKLMDSLNKLDAASYDVAIFGDVLEHLYDPESAIQYGFDLIKSNGELIICIPNVQHWSVFQQLIMGSWPRLDAGLFDKTHIRWFTLDDIVGSLIQKGLIIKSVNPRIFNPERGIDIVEYLEPLAVYLQKDAQYLLERSLPLQYVIVAVKP